MNYTGCSRITQTLDDGVTNFKLRKINYTGFFRITQTLDDGMTNFKLYEKLYGFSLYEMRRITQLYGNYTKIIRNGLRPGRAVTEY